MITTSVFILFLCVEHSFAQIFLNKDNSECYDMNKKAKLCTPPFVNSAYLRKVQATNTCGMKKPEEFCVQSGALGFKTICDTCDNTDPVKRHPSEYLTDYNQEIKKSWWQSQTLLEFKELEKMTVNLTMNFGIQFKITYISIKFHTPRPASMVIYKKFDDNSPWEPMQYFSSSCEATFNKPSDQRIATEDSVVCISKYSDLVPLSGGAVIYSTLENRPGSSDFLNNQRLQQFVTGSQLRIELKRLNPFGDEIFGDNRVLKTYFYAIYDISVGGRCNCNGHASSCTLSTGRGTAEAKLFCNCEHNTEGQTCDRCLRGFSDRPWEPASAADAHECRPCDCNGNSNICFFDPDLYKLSGKTSGGHCINCKNNTEGPHCERCKMGHYKPPGSGACVPCNCNILGSVHSKCSASGHCLCKPGVLGPKCDRCRPGFFGFGPLGCRSCKCQTAGSFGGQPDCDVGTGVCRCKENVEGKVCERCLPGFFGLSAQDPIGCQPCFCFGHSAICKPRANQYAIEKKAPLLGTGWRVVDMEGKDFPIDFVPATSSLPAHLTPRIQWSDTSFKTILFYVAPPYFLGDQRRSYNQLLSLDISFDSVRGVVPSYLDLILQSFKREISLPLTTQDNPVPVPNRVLTYRFRLSENNRYRWEPPTLTTQEMHALLMQLTAIKIRATYAEIYFGDETGRARLHEFRLGTVTDAPSPDALPTRTLEQCICPPGYTGRQCETCLPGFRREKVNGGAFSRCLPCRCSGHSDACDPNTGACQCRHNTEGASCDRCKPGFFGNATRGTAADCKLCPCPQGGPCALTAALEVVCLRCPPGHSGARCERCQDGFFGLPPKTSCIPCRCSGNIDPNAIGVCDSRSGECQRCAYNTGGIACEHCAPGHFGNALALPRGQCRSCGCHSNGTYRDENGDLSCNRVTGVCLCLERVSGPKCTGCIPGTYGMTPGRGCRSCDCKPLGSSSPVCDPVTGLCTCKPGVNQRDCSKCAPLHFNMTRDGCTACRCSPLGSFFPQCNDKGQCACKPFVVGKKCDACQRNRFDLNKGCVPCPPCYDLIEKRVSDHEARLKALKAFIKAGSIFGNSSFDRKDFDRRLKDLKSGVEALMMAMMGPGGSDTWQIFRLSDRIKEMNEALLKMAPVREQTAAEAGKLMSCNYEACSAGIEALTKQVLETTQLVLRDGNSALGEAKANQDKSGKFNAEMKNLAEEARKLTKRHKTDADEMEKLLNDLKTSLLDFKKLVDAVPPKISELEKKMAKIISDWEKLKKLVQAIKTDYTNELEDLNRKALELARLAEKQGNRDVTDLRKALDEVKKKANDLKQLAQSLKKERTQKITELMTQMAAAQNLLTALNRRLTEKKPQLSQLKKLNEEALKTQKEIQELVKKVNEIKKTLDSLNGEYNKKVAEWKRKAEEAVKAVPMLKEMLKELKKKITAAMMELFQNAAAVSDAGKKANVTKAGAAAAKADQEQLLERAKKLLTKQGALTHKTDENEKRLAQAKRSLEEEEKNLNGAEMETERLARKTADNNKDADGAKAAVDEALKDVDKILRDLNDMTIDSVKLAQLEKRVAALKSNVNEKLDREMAGLEQLLPSLLKKELKLQQNLGTFKDQRKLLIDIERKISAGKCFVPTAPK